MNKRTHGHMGKTQGDGYVSPLPAYCSPSTLHGCSQLDTCHVQQPCLLGGEQKLCRFQNGEERKHK